MLESRDQNIGRESGNQTYQSDKLLQILVVRSDRLGDVILSTPVFEVLKRHYSKSHLTAMVQENVLPILKGLPSIDRFITFEPDGRHSGIKGFRCLYSEIKKGDFKIAVVLNSHWKIAAALFLARVKYRIGPLSKFHSFLFYNLGLRQRRSHVEMHEADYNLQLLRKLGIRIGTRNVSTRVWVTEQVRNEAKAWLVHRGWDSTKNLIAIHPGMGGSALNWPETHYSDLLKSLVEEGKQLLITGGRSEGDLLCRLERRLESVPGHKKIIFYRADSQSKIDFLAGLFYYADLVIAPSTGPLHLAVAIQRPVLTFYPPIRVQSALRWGPYLSDENRASVLVPEMFCGQDFKCLENLCHYYPCMKSLTVKEALLEVKKQLARNSNNATK